MEKLEADMTPCGTAHAEIRMRVNMHNVERLNQLSGGQLTIPTTEYLVVRGDETARQETTSPETAVDLEELRQLFTRPGRMTVSVRATISLRPNDNAPLEEVQV